MGRKSSKDAIFAAAERVIRRQGLAGTTIEGVAAEAGMSKGGLFYHFASKKELLLQLMEHFEQKFRQTQKEIFDSLPDEPGRLLKATILASIRQTEANNGNNVANIVTLLDDVELRAKVSEAKRKLFAEISEGYPYPEKTALAMLVTDGLWLANVFETSYPEELREKIVAQLLTLIDAHTAADLAPPKEQPPQR